LVRTQLCLFSTRVEPYLLVDSKTGKGNAKHIYILSMGLKPDVLNQQKRIANTFSLTQKFIK